jgi:uncharacterized paraquat-inducible protein A
MQLMNWPKNILKLANLSLLIFFPIAWFAPLLKAGLLPFFSLSEISVISGIQALWEKDIFLAIVVSALALLAPLIKVLSTALIQFDLLSAKYKPILIHLGRLAMADIFLIAIYIVVAKGVGVGRLETGWGLYLFTACVLASYAITIFDKSGKETLDPQP